MVFQRQVRNAENPVRRFYSTYRILSDFGFQAADTGGNEGRFDLLATYKLGFELFHQNDLLSMHSFAEL